jgi:hypothetical protein
MKKTSFGLIFCMLMLGLTVSSYASLNQFAGFWKNVDPNTGGITKLNIKVNGTSVTVHAWGKCHPTDCDMGTVKAIAYAPKVTSHLTSEAIALTAIFKKSFAQTLMVIRPYSKGRLRVSIFDHFTDNSKRTDFTNTFIFKRSLFVKPLQVSYTGDCISYDPHKLRIVNEGAAGWLLTDGRSRMLMLDNESDARKALALAKRYTKQCFIGRDNTKPNRKDYIVQFWEGSSGISTNLGKEDCIGYNPQNLRIVDEGSKGWLLTDGRSRMLMLANQEDARKALALAKRYSKQCFIGRDNTRPNRKDYIVGYWK